MIISKVCITPVFDTPRLKAYASITFSDGLFFTINDVKIIKADRGLCVEFPKDQRSIDLHSETVAPRDKETRNYFEATIIGAYHNYFLTRRKRHEKNLTSNRNHDDRCSA